MAEGEYVGLTEEFRHDMDRRRWPGYNDLFTWLCTNNYPANRHDYSAMKRGDAVLVDLVKGFLVYLAERGHPSESRLFQAVKGQRRCKYGS